MRYYIRGVNSPKMEILLPLFSQRDSRWKNKKLGTSSNTIGSSGCLVDCWSMVAKHYGKDTDPDRFNEALKQLTLSSGGGFGYAQDSALPKLSDGTYPKDLYIWGSINKIYSDISETKMVQTPNPVSSTQFSSIESEINAGRPVIVEVDFIPETSKADMHFVLIVGKSEDGKYIIIDPWFGDKSSLDRYGKPNVTIQRFIFTLGPTPIAPVDQPNDDQKRAVAVVTEGYNTLPNDSSKPGNMESYARSMVDQFKIFPTLQTAAKQLDAFLDKWFHEWNLKEDPNKSHQVILEDEMGKFLTIEQKAEDYRNAIEEAVGQPLEDDNSLLAALKAIQNNKEALKGQLEECQAKVGGNILKAYTVGNYIIRIIKKPQK